MVLTYSFFFYIKQRPSSHLFKSGNPIDNTYNTEPGKKSIPKAPSSDDANINKTSDVNAAKRKRSKKRGRKNRKRKRNGKKRRRNKKKKRKKLPPVVNIQVIYAIEEFFFQKKTHHIFKHI